MKKIRVALAASILLAASAAGAQVHKCQTPDGKTSYSDSPCPGARPAPSAPATQPAPSAKPPDPAPAARQRYVKPAPGSMSEGIELLMKEACDKGTREACEVHQAIKAGLPHGEAFSELGKKRCDNGDRDGCQFYCKEDPSSRKCLEKTGKGSGAGWYQIDERSTDPRRAVREWTTVGCRAKSLENHHSYTQAIQCESGLTQCTYAGGEYKRFPTFDAAATEACNLAEKNLKPSTAQADERERLDCAKDPGSAPCLAKAGRASGKSWYELAGRGPSILGNGETMIPIACRQVPLDAPRRGGWVQVSCRPNDASCTHNREPVREIPRYDTLDAAASDACRKAYDVYQRTPR